MSDERPGLPVPLPRRPKSAPSERIEEVASQAGTLAGEVQPVPTPQEERPAGALPWEAFEPNAERKRSHTPPMNDHDLEILRWLAATDEHGRKPTPLLMMIVSNALREAANERLAAMGVDKRIKTQYKV